MAGIQMFSELCFMIVCAMYLNGCVNYEFMFVTTGRKPAWEDYLSNMTSIRSQSYISSYREKKKKLLRNMQDRAGSIWGYYASIATTE